MSEKTFYVVWNPAARTPYVKHPSDEMAREEAKRLAMQNPSDVFVVLRAIESVRYSENPFQINTFSRQ